MDKDEVARRLKEAGSILESVRVNAAGQLVYLVRLSSGERVAMFHEDAADMVSARATVGEIIIRNVKADLADPWPDSN